MKSSILAAQLALCLAASLVMNFANTQDLKLDLDKGIATPTTLANGITWHQSLTSPPNSCTCSRQGVLKLTFDTTQRVRAEVVFWFEAHRQWTFHFADSVTNNGWGGDYTTQFHCAELHSLDQQLQLWGKVIPDGSGKIWGLLVHRTDFLNGVNKLVVNIADELVTVDNGRQSIYYNSFKIFALRDQPDPRGPVNNDVYLGLNRVVDGNYRAGTGLCNVDITWHNTTL